MIFADESAGEAKHHPAPAAAGGVGRFVRAAALPVLAALPLALGALSLGAGAEASPCKAPLSLVRFHAPLPHLIRAFKSGKLVSIVALGSSSTAGRGASSPQATYPAQLDNELERRFDGWDFKVTNLGVGGQLAQDMLARLDHDVLPRRPALVLWQTGVNDAIRHADLAAFRATLKAGIERLHAHEIDVVLVNMQFYPRSEQVPGYADYLRAMHDVAAEEDVPVFRRFAIMKSLIETGQFTLRQMLSRDQFHMNDLSYGCLAVLIADAIEDQVSAFLDSRETATVPGPRAQPAAPRR